MYRGKTQFHSPAWLKVFLAASAVFVSVLSVFEYRANEFSLIFLSLLIMSVIMIAGAVAVFTERIELDENDIIITHNFKRAVVPRANIEKVTWAKGCDALLVLKDGGSIKLPGVGKTSQALCNSIRAWIKAA